MRRHTTLRNKGELQKNLPICTVKALEAIKSIKQDQITNRRKNLYKVSLNEQSISNEFQTTMKAISCKLSTAEIWVFMVIYCVHSNFYYFFSNLQSNNLVFPTFDFTCFTTNIKSNGFEIPQTFLFSPIPHLYMPVLSPKTL